ncbi:6-phosphogluconolactonase [Thermocrinis sp.]
MDTLETKLFKLFLRLFDLFIKRKERIHVALAGGRTPMEFYRLLSQQAIPWERILFFLTDERLNPNYSNYKSIRENLGERAHILAVDLNLPVDKACEEYSKLLPDSLDIALLGVGEDGHTASLFPKTECKNITQKVCLSTSPDGMQRISLTYDYLNLSCVVVFAMKGESKKEAYEKLIRGEDIPASRIKGRRKTLILYQP